MSFLFYYLCVCLSVCLHKKWKTTDHKLMHLGRKYVLWWTLEDTFRWRLTLLFDLRSNFRIFWWENFLLFENWWSDSDAILHLMCIRWFCKSTKSGQILSWPLTLRAKIIGSAQVLDSVPYSALGVKLKSWFRSYGSQRCWRLRPVPAQALMSPPSSP